MPNKLYANKSFESSLVCDPQPSNQNSEQVQQLQTETMIPTIPTVVTETVAFGRAKRKPIPNSNYKSGVFFGPDENTALWINHHQHSTELNTHLLHIDKDVVSILHDPPLEAVFDLPSSSANIDPAQPILSSTLTEKLLKLGTMSSNASTSMNYDPQSSWCDLSNVQDMKPVTSTPSNHGTQILSPLSVTISTSSTLASDSSTVDCTSTSFSQSPTRPTTCSTSPSVSANASSTANSLSHMQSF